jgi:hypothetical protein
LIAEIDYKEEVSQQKREVHQQKVLEHQNKPKKLGRHKFEEDPIPVLLSEQLPGNLRNLKVCFALNNTSHAAAASDRPS